MKTVSFESHVTGLSRLLATENISVSISKEIEDPAFNVEKRQLKLPTWVNTNDSYFTDLIIEHEMGHAIYTPVDKRLKEADSLMLSCLNIVEDVRIEKLMKRRFPGSRQDFYKGYQFFYQHEKLAELRENVKKDNLCPADRINIRAKFGHVVDVKMDPILEGLYKRIENAESFDEVFILAEQLKELMLKTSQTSGKQIVNTPALLAAVMKNCQQDKESEQAQNCEIQPYPKINFQDYIVPMISMKQQRAKTRNRLYGPSLEMFLKNNQSIINTMMIEFEARKAAALLARQKQSKTGSLDMRRLADHRVADDIFKSMLKIPEGKNHGIVMLLDQSYSMQNYYQSTINQAIVLLEFCRRVGIPVTLMGFGMQRDYINFTGNVNYNEQFCLKPYVEPGMTRSDYWEVLHSLVQLADITLSGESAEKLGNKTPLNGSMAVLTEYAVDFKAKTNADVVTIVLLTDGDATDTLAQSVLSSPEGVDYIFIKNQIMSERLLTFSPKDQFERLAAFYRKVYGFNYMCIKLNDCMPVATTVDRKRGFDSIFYLPVTFYDIDPSSDSPTDTKKWLHDLVGHSSARRRIATLIAGELAV